MKILRLVDNQIKPITTIPVKIKDKIHHSIRNGLKAKNFWSYHVGVSDIIVADKNINKPIELTGNNFNINPIKNKNTNKQLKDSNGNYMYFIGYDYNGISDNHILLFWIIPNNRYKNVTYELYGDAAVLGEGTTGIERDGILYTSPAPVVEITGSCSLKWKGINMQDEEISETYTFNKHGELK